MVEVKEKIEVREQSAQVDEAGQVLLRAADVIRRDGWAQGIFCNEAGNVCTAGAIKKALGLDPNFGYVSDIVDPHYERFTHSLGLPLYGAIGTWNDAPERTKEEVIEALERAAYGL